MTNTIEHRVALTQAAAPAIVKHSPVVIYTIRINDYAPELTDLTFPLMRHWASKIGARVEVIDKRLFEPWPISFEKFQTPMRALDAHAEWAYTVDADTLIHPDWFAVHEVIGKDTVAHNGKDFNPIRWTQDKYFRRDARYIGSCSWFTVASDWCYEDLWHFPEQSYEETLAAIHPTGGEMGSGLIPKEHLCDDYTLSRNIARFGLKYTTFIEICKDRIAVQGNPLLWHHYQVSNETKFARMCAAMVAWGVMSIEDAKNKGKQWGIQWDACPGPQGNGNHSGPCQACSSSGVLNARRTK